MLEVVALGAGYGRAQALFGVALQVSKGEVVALLGRNGAGNSTTRRRVVGLSRRTAGEVRFGGRRIDGLAPREISRLGLGHVPEERRIFADLTVAESLAVGRQPRRAGTAGWSDERLLELFPAL